MKIGIVGHGVVGEAIKEGFEYLEHDVLVHDTKFWDTSVSDLIDTEICFLCVPTPQREDGKCDTSIVESVVRELLQVDYRGLIAVKSTVTPGLVDSLSEKFNIKNICFVPEFLRERCASYDFIHNHDLCVVGVYSDEDYQLVKKAHGNLPKSFRQCTPIEAEFVKYFNNVYNATLITFANSFSAICESMNVDYGKIKEVITQRNHIQDIYLNSSEDTKGFGGACLPKDTSALNELAKDVEKYDISFFEDILKQNSEFETTVFKGMRE